MDVPYLTTRAKKKQPKQAADIEQGISTILSSKKEKEGGITYFSYGRVHYRAASTMLFDEFIDTNNSLIHDPSSLHGLFELARVCGGHYIPFPDQQLRGR